MIRNVILLNGPPSSGKDTVAREMKRLLSLWGFHVIHEKFSAVLKDTAHSMIGQKYIRYDNYESCKDRPNVEFPVNPETSRCYTPREFYILVSEKMLKPCFGQRFFGWSLVKKLQRMTWQPDTVVILSDSGFAEETIPLKEYFGSSMLDLVQIERQGTNFDKDSRSYWSDPEIATHSLKNDSDLYVLSDKVSALLELIVGRPTNADE